MVDHDVDVMVGIPSVGDWTNRQRWEVNQALMERGTESLPTTVLRHETCRGIINHCPLIRPAMTRLLHFLRKHWVGSFDSH